MQRSVRRTASILVGDVDLPLTLAFLGLMCIGVLMVYSASIGNAYTYYGSQYYVLEREVAFAALGLVMISITARVNYHRWMRIAAPFFGVTMLLLVLVLTHVGHISHGARRWFSLGAGISLEPSELIKLALILYLATWLPRKGAAIRELEKTFVPFSLAVGLVVFLIVRQPDLGTAIVIAATAFAVFFVAGADVRHMVIVAAGSGCFAWVLIHSSSYRQERLTAFMDPWKDPTGVGWHTVQALQALGSGGVFGTGLGNGVGKFVLPAPHTDSILAVIGEELGLAGTVTILLLFMVVAYRGMRIATCAPDPFGRLLAAGITSWITLQALMNFAVITSSVPFTGVPLPFISYGGTSLIITTTAMGILLNISRHNPREGFAHNTDHRRGDGRPPVPRVIDSPVPEARRARPHRAPAVSVSVRRSRRSAAQ
ncbi:MAG: putative lipid II flippase FtsW [Chloroflexota bacterium]